MNDHRNPMTGAPMDAREAFDADHGLEARPSVDCVCVGNQAGIGMTTVERFDYRGRPPVDEPIVYHVHPRRFVEIAVVAVVIAICAYAVCVVAGLAFR